MKDNLTSVLVVEDNPSNLSVLFNLLDEAGFEVLVSLDGESAIRSAEEGHPDLILLDVMLTGIDGFETCRRLKSSEKTRAIPVIFMTALTRTFDKVQGFELGAVDYITKPFEPEEVLMRVKTHLTIQKLQHDLRTKNEELQASVERERELNQLKSRFLSIASHEFRTPLTTIFFSSNLLRRSVQKLTDQEAVAEMLPELVGIEKTVRQMTGTLDEILRMAKSETGQWSFRPTVIDLSDLCRNVVDKFSLLAAETHTIVFAEAVAHLQAYVDPKLLEQVLSNLLSNAIKYSPNGRPIRCELGQENGNITISVKDEGIGIPEADQRRLFEAFYRGVNVQDIQGAGLGLSIVKQFVELHGGTVALESEANKGATFTVVLPLRN